MAAKSGGRINFTKLGIAVIDELTWILRDLLKGEIKPSLIAKKVNSSTTLPKLRLDQELLINKAKTAGYTDFDTTLLYTILRNECPNIPPPTNGWGKEPGPTDITVGDDIERIRLIRNKVLAHISTASVPDSEYQIIRAEIEAICQRMEIHLGSTHSYVQNLQQLEMKSIDEELETTYIEKLQSMVENEKDLTEMIQALSSKVEDIKTQVERSKNLSEKLKIEAETRIEIDIVPEKKRKHRSFDNLLDVAHETLKTVIRSITEESTVEEYFEVCKQLEHFIESIENKEEFQGLFETIESFQEITNDFAQKLEETKRLSILSRFYELVINIRRYRGKFEVQHGIRKYEGSELLKNRRNAVLLWSILAQDQHCINLKENIWEKTYQTAAGILEVDPIPSVPELLQDKGLASVISTDGNQLRFETQERRETFLLELSGDRKFKQFFLTNACTENIMQYCRTSGYVKEEGEVCFCLAESQTDELIERLGLEILTHPTMEDTNIHSVVSKRFNLPMEVMKWKKGGIERFRHHLQYGKKQVFCARGMLVGCTGAGKTTLLKRLKDMHISEVIKTESTRGIDVHMDVLEVYGNTLKVREGTHRSCYLGIDPCLFSASAPTDELEVSAKVIRTSFDVHRNKRESSQQESAESAPIIQPGITTKEENVTSTGDVDIKQESSLPNIVKSHHSIPLFLSDIVEKENDPTVSFMDFAGQIEYYACHPVYMSPRSFYLLVIDMSISLDEKMESELCGYFAGWTHFEYIAFWLNMVHHLICKDKITNRKEECHKRCPIILVATHAEGKTEEEKDDFFEEVQRRLPDNGIKDHICKEHAIGFVKDADSIEDLTELKKDICSLVKSLGHWGEFLPTYWVYFEKKIRQMKDDENKKIIRLDDLNDIKDRLYTEMNFWAFSTDDLALMLQFFHETGIILHFDQENLRNIIILDIQWFVDGFKYIITAKTHSRKDLRECLREWDFFNKTGELHCNLLEILWRKSPLHLEYKDQLLQYMEWLGMLVSVSEANETWWYVPCMNKTPFSREIFQQFQKCSSTLCFIFESLAMFIYFRFVAACVSRWTILTERNRRYNRVKRHLYQTMAVFLHKNHNILIGIERETIQLQVFTIEIDIDKRITREIRSLCQDILKELSTTFNTNIPFSFGYKCKISAIGDEHHTSILQEKYFSGETAFQCTDCPIGKKHQVKAKEILSFWEKDEAISSELDQHLLDKESTGFRKSDPHTTDVYLSDMKSSISKSVGKLAIGDRVLGTGFRVGDKYIMTNLHVLQGYILDTGHGCTLRERLYMRFEEKKIGQIPDPASCFVMLPIVLYLDKELDVAVLEMNKHPFHKDFPPPLTTFGNVNFNIDIYLLGHSGGFQMKEDTIQPMKRDGNTALLIKNLKEFSRKYLPGKINYYEELNDPKRILFHTTFYPGCSGSPGIQLENYTPRIVLMVRGGTPSCHYDGTCMVPNDKMVEIGISMSDIRDNMMQNKYGLASHIFKTWIN